MAMGLRDRYRALRKRLRVSIRGPVDVVVSHCEVNDRHGTGVLLQRLFGAGPRIVSIRSRDLYGGEQHFGARRLLLDHGGISTDEVAERVGIVLGGIRVRRILCAPDYPDDARTALALALRSGAPLVTWVMDDQNIHLQSIGDDLLRPLFERSGLRLAISPELRAAYEEKFGLPFALVPPVAPAEHLLPAPATADAVALSARRGLLLGNVWGPAWLEGLLATVAGSGVALDWHAMGGTPWRRDDPARLAAAGIRILPFLPEPALVEALRASPFVLVPTGALDGDDSHGSLARLSLPSRITFTTATAGTPLLVLGHAESAAAQFVTRHGLGRVVPYERGAFVAAVDALLTPAAQSAHREAAARLAPILSSDGTAEWIWGSLAAGEAADGRFAALDHRD
jgi:hypothetical protein